MRYDTVKQVAIVQADNPVTFQKRFNKLLATLSHQDPEVKIDRIGDEYFAIVTYKETAHTIESVADEFEAAGFFFDCRHCPLHDVETDGRKKWVTCKYAFHGMTSLNSSACEVFYRRLNLGEIKPVGKYADFKNPFTDDDDAEPELELVKNG